MERDRLETYIFFGLLVGVAALVGAIFLPYLGSLVLAVIFAMMFDPVYERLRRWFGGHGAAAALVTVILIVLVVFVPVSYFGYRIFDEATGLYIRVSDGVGAGYDVAPPGIVGNYADRLGIRLETAEIAGYVRQFLGWLIPNLGAVLSGVFDAVGVIGLALVGIFYFLKDGKKFEESLVDVSPLAPLHTRQILDALHLTVHSVITGTLVVAVVQGLLAGLGLWLFGVPSPVLWGSFAVIASLIPLVGAAAVTVPAALFLLLTGHLGAMAGFLVWSVFVVSSIDNVLRPYLIERGVKVHPFIILLSVLGAIGFFGPIGFLVGPLLVSLFVTLLQMTRGTVRV